MRLRTLTASLKWKWSGLETLIFRDGDMPFFPFYLIAPQSYVGSILARHTLFFRTHPFHYFILHPPHIKNTCCYTQNRSIQPKYTANANPPMPIYIPCSVVL